MTREDIEKKGMDYFGFTGKSNDIDSQVRELLCKAFVEGAQWRINSVWHDASEVPEANKRVLVCFENVIGEYVYYRIRAFKPNVLKNWNMGNFLLDKKVLYWCYLDDLLPERKEETE